MSMWMVTMDYAVDVFVYHESGSKINNRMMTIARIQSNQWPLLPKLLLKQLRPNLKFMTTPPFQTNKYQVAAGKAFFN